MAKHYSTRDFFRQMPNALLARYFQSKALFENLDFTSMKETKTDPLFESWLNLPDVLRNVLDAEMLEIFDICNEKGFLAILDEARWQFRNTPEKIPPLVDKLSAMSNHFERAMITFLDYNACWKGATRFHHADSLPYWRKRKNLPHVPAAVDDASLQHLADLIRHYFHYTEGRGNNCVVEPFRRGDRDYFFAYPEDHSQRSIEWVDGVFNPRPHNSAIEVVFVYSQKEGSLDLNFRGANKAIEALQGMFATAILKLDEIPPDPKDQRVYDLNPLRQKSFNFVYDLDSGIETVVVKKLRLSSRINKGDRITLEADTEENPDAVYVLLDKIGKSLPIHLFNVTQVEIAATIVSNADKPPRTVMIRITYPNSCSLKYDELDLRLRDMLEASDIEPKEPMSEVDDDKETTEATEA